VCCSVLQCVAVCCSALQCVAVCCSVLQCVAVCYRVLQSVAMCADFWEWLPARPLRARILNTRCVAVCCRGEEWELRRERGSWSAVCCSVLQCVAVCCSVLQCDAVARNESWDERGGCGLQCVAVRCSVLQCVAVCCSVEECATSRGPFLSISQRE